jgi:DNA-binding GntR family transcriptional regulator
MDKRRLRRAQKEHQQLVQLIETGDGEGAEHLWTRHLSKSDDEVMPGRITSHSQTEGEAASWLTGPQA